MSGTRVHLRTFGCRANHYDTEQARAMLERAGLEVVADAADADVAIMNSCAVTAEAEADLRQAVRRVARERPGVRTIVTGCAAARSADAIGELPGVSDVIAGADLATLARTLSLPEEVAIGAAAAQTGARGLLRVQDGCDEHCTFCATTLARGAHRSRRMEELVDEATRLADRHAEIVVTGIHVGSWGKEWGHSLGTLLERLVRDVPRARFRLASVEATEVDDQLAALLRDDDRVCPYLHAPLQSASDRLLRVMGRHWYTGATYAAAIERLTRGRSAFGLGADIVTGFPGETPADHEITCAMVRALPFTHLHVFPYSERPGTAALRLPGRVPAPVAKDRASELRAIGEAKGAAYRASRVGGTAAVAVISVGSPRHGLTEDYLSVEIEGVSPARGSIVTARLHAPALPTSPTLIARP